MGMRRGLAIFVAALVFFCLWDAPASVVAGLAGVKDWRFSGTWRQGEASRLLTPDRPVFLSWHLNPWSLLGGRIGGQVDLRAGESALAAQVAWQGGRLILSSLCGRLQDDVVVVVSGGTIRGAMEFDVRRLVMENDCLRSANGDIVVRDVSLLVPSPLALGDLVLTLNGKDGKTFLDGRCREEVACRIKGRLDGDGSYRATVLFRPGDGREWDFLRAAGQATENGWLRLEHHGRLGTGCERKKEK